MTGGQFSLVRIVLGALVLGDVARAAFAGDVHVIAIVVGAALGVTLVLGWQTRVVAGVTALGQWLHMSHDADWLVAFLALFVFARTPGEPYLSWGMRGRINPGGDWSFDGGPRRTARDLHVLALAVTAIWVVLPLFTEQVSAGRLGQLPDTPRLVVVLLLAGGLLTAAVRSYLGRLGRLGWTTVLLVALLGLVGLLPVPAALLVLHLLAFDPAWLPQRRDGSEPALVFYDGHCGLCHRTVRLLLAEDPTGDTFRFSPLQGATFPERVSERDELPDSVLVLTPDGRLLMRSAAAIEALWRLGGLWRALGHGLWLVPRPLRDLGYAGVAKVRKAIFGAPEAACPIIPADLAQRFLP